jgi:nucleoside-diphosphate-sugar epimerase
LSERIILLGAGFVGCEVGWHLAHDCHRVQLIDILPEERLLVDEHSLNRATLFHQLQQADVPIACNATPSKIPIPG